MKKSIEDTAREYAESNYHPLLEHLDYIKFCDITDSFIAGYARAIEESAEGFEVKTAREYMEQDHKMSNDDFCFIYNKLLIPVYQTLVPLDIKRVMDFTFDYAFDSGRRAAKLSSQKELAEKDERIKMLEKCVEGYYDLIFDNEFSTPCLLGGSIRLFNDAELPVISQKGTDNE